MSIGYDHLKTLYAEIVFMTRCKNPRLVEFYGISF